MEAVWRVRFDLSPAIAALQQAGDAAANKVHATIGAIAMETMARWKAEVMHAKLWSVEKGRYFDSIEWRFTGPLTAEVWTDYGLAKDIETGRPARDLKRMLETSPRVRETKTGKRYLIIPFRHNMTALQDAGVYQQAKALSPSSIVGTKHVPSITGAWDVKTKAPALVPRHSYSWGERLPAGLVPKLKDHHATDPLAGLVRFNTSAGKGKSSAYLTFRVMMEGSPKWIVPAKPGLHITKAVSDVMTVRAGAMFAEAFKGSA